MPVAEAQTCVNQGSAPDQDFDCDGVLNSSDLDDDNDGISDVDEGFIQSCAVDGDFNGGITTINSNIEYTQSLADVTINFNATNGTISPFSATTSGADELYASGTSITVLEPDPGGSVQDMTFSTGAVYVQFAVVDIDNINEDHTVRAYDESGNLITNLGDFITFSIEGTSGSFPGTPTVFNDLGTTITITDNGNNVRLQGTIGSRPQFQRSTMVMFDFSNQLVSRIEVENNTAGPQTPGVLFHKVIVAPEDQQDSDGDGNPDYLDTDSDGDGCFDALEGSGSITSTLLDSNGDGMIDILTNGVDADGVAIGYSAQGILQGVGSSTNENAQSASCAPPVPNNDSDLDNPPGTSVTFDILGNDVLGDGVTSPAPADVTVTLDETSVPGGVLNVDGSVTVPGEGTWSYNSATGEITFAPCTAAGVPDVTCAGALLADPTPIDYSITEISTGLTSDVPATITVTYIPTTISGSLFNDVDGNGSGSTAEGVLAGVTVNLLDAGGNPVVDGNGDPVTAVTGADGSYLFTGNFVAGDYQISVDPTTLPGGDPSNIDGPIATFDPDGIGTLNTAAISVTPGADVTAQDFGYTGDSLPVTLSSISSERLGSKIKMDWSTSSELFNVGFQLWGLDGKDQKWEKLHGWLIRSGRGNAVEAQSYRKTVNIPGSISDLIAVGISSVDSDGSEHYYGPFNVGQSYGDLNQLKPIAWNHIRAEVDTQMAARGYIKDRVNGYRKVMSAASSATSESAVEFRVSESGMYRISAAQLLSAGIDWGDVRRGDIALLDHTGKAVVRYVSARGDGNGQNKTLGSKGDIYFYGQSPDEQQGLYSDSSVYRLVLNRYQALKAQYQRKQGIGSGFSAYYIERAVVEDDAQYVLTSAADDPWISRAVVGYPNKPSLYGLQIPVEADALWDQGATLRLGLGRSSALTLVDLDGDGQSDSEHIVEGLVLSPAGTNGLLNLSRQTATGSGEWTVEFPIEANTPLTISNGHVIAGGAFSAGNGYAFSEVHVDHIGLDYARPYVAKAGDKHLAFTAPNQTDQGYEVVIPDKGYPVVFGSDGSNLVRVGLESQIKQMSGAGEKQRMVRFAALPVSFDAEMHYWVSAKTGYLSVDGLIQKTTSSQDALVAKASGSDLLLISHPAFMGDDLARYAAFKQSQGYRAAIINYLDVVDSFGGGQAGPHGLTSYLAQVESQGDLAHVLLVGGGTYDHTDKLGTGAVTFIPGHYGQSSYSAYTASDAPYVMADKGDLMATIGRWPVRSGGDLQTIVDKSIAWSNRDHSSGQVLVIAEQTVTGENINFSAALQGVASNLPTTWGTTRVDVDAIMAANPGLNLTQAITQAREAIIDGLNNTPDVVLYNGHATTSQLSNKGLFKSSHVSSVTASGAEVWLPMSCYMTFYESTHVNTLSHQLLFTGNAVGITGAMLLSSQSGNIAMGTAILNGSVNEGLSFGESVKAQKTDRNNANLTINWGNLGDPTLKM